MQGLRAVLALPRNHPSAGDAALAGLLLAAGIGEALIFASEAGVVEAGAR